MPKALHKVFSRRERFAIGFLCSVFILTYVLTLTDIFVIFPSMDILLHFLGGFFVALFFISYLRRALMATNSFVGDAMIIVGVSLLVGVGWEIFEFILDKILPPGVSIFRGGDLFDTLKDLVVDAIGAAVMFLLVRGRYPKSAMFK
jgi:uncharacterized membrane protein YjdF